MSKVLITESYLEDIADAIREKSGGGLTYKPSEMAGAILNIPSGGSDLLEQQLNNTLLSYSSNDVTNVPEYAFSGRTNIQTIELPNATLTGTRQFQGCTSLTRLYLPKVKTTTAYMCDGDTALVDYDFSEVTSISGENVFRNTGLTGVYAPKATAAGAFNAGHLTGCTALVYCRIPKLAGGVRSGFLSNCTSLKLVDMGKATTLASAGNCFNGCPALEVLILRKTDSITNINRTTDFGNVTSPITVYVPNDLKSAYEAATNWAAYVSAGKITFAKLEGSAYEQPDFVYMGVPSA